MTGKDAAELLTIGTKIAVLVRKVKEVITVEEIDAMLRHVEYMEAMFPLVHPERYMALPDEAFRETRARCMALKTILGLENFKRPGGE